MAQRVYGVEQLVLQFVALQLGHGREHITKPLLATRCGSKCAHARTVQYHPRTVASLPGGWRRSFDRESLDQIAREGKLVSWHLLQKRA